MARPINSVGDAYDRLIEAKPGCIQGFVCDAAFQDIGTPGDYWTTSFELSGRPARPKRRTDAGRASAPARA